VRGAYQANEQANAAKKAHDGILTASFGGAVCARGKDGRALRS